MGILTWIVIGAIAGWLASRIMKGRGYGLVKTVVIGIIGAFVGGWLSTRIFNLPYAVTGFDVTSIVVATAGAVVVLFVLSLMKS